jgi:hypothetical protein
VHDACKLAKMPYVDVGLRGVSRILSVAKNELEPRILEARAATKQATPTRSKRKSRRKQ